MSTAKVTNPNGARLFDGPNGTKFIGCKAPFDTVEELVSQEGNWLEVVHGNWCSGFTSPTAWWSTEDAQIQNDPPPPPSGVVVDILSLTFDAATKTGRLVYTVDGVEHVKDF